MMSDNPDRDLLYAVDDAGNMVFAPRHSVEQVRQVRAWLKTRRTWRDARRDLPPAYFDELIEMLVAPVDLPVNEDAAVPEQEIAYGEWPAFMYHQMEDWLPNELFEQFGEGWSGLLDEGCHLPVTPLDSFDSQSDEILEWLHSRGYRC